METYNGISRLPEPKGHTVSLWCKTIQIQCPIQAMQSIEREQKKAGGLGSWGTRSSGAVTLLDRVSVCGAGPCRRSTAGGEGGLSGGGLGRKFVCRGGPGRLACSPEVTVKNIWFNLMQETL